MLIGGTPNHVYSLLIIYSERYRSMTSYADTQIKIEWMKDVLMRYFALPNSLFAALNMLSRYPILNMSIPSKRDFIDQRSMLKFRTMCIVPIIIFEHCQHNNTWVISVNLSRRYEPNCFFLLRYPGDLEGRKKCQREYKSLTFDKVPWMTIWECLADVIKRANLII